MAATTPRLRSIALPPEHGSWGFLLEPLLLGLLVAPSMTGIWLTFGVIGLFMARQPARIALIDWQRGKRYARTRLAEQLTAAFGAVGIAGFALALALGGITNLLPFALGIPLALIVFASYSNNRGRDLLPELAGAAALALAAFSLALAGGESVGVGLALWVIVLARNLPSILYIRARLRLDKVQPFTPVPAVATHLAGCVGVGAFVALGYAPWLALAAMLVLTARAVYGLSPYRQRVRVQAIGFLEIFYGLLTVVLVALGYALGI